jgi:hypothetical protein
MNIDKRTHDLELNYQVNSAQALSKMKHRLVTFTTRTHLSLITSVDKPLSRHVLMAFLLGFISIISSLLLLFMKALTIN